MSEHDRSGTARKVLKAGVIGLAVIGSIGAVAAAGLVLFWAFILGMGGGQLG
jgi:hypothetical protein